jgi:hypothetical protein
MGVDLEAIKIQNLIVDAVKQHLETRELKFIHLCELLDDVYSFIKNTDDPFRKLVLDYAATKVPYLQGRDDFVVMMSKHHKLAADLMACPSLPPYAQIWPALKMDE